MGFDQDMIDRFYADYDVPTETVPMFDEEGFDDIFERTKNTIVQMNAENGCVSRYGRTLAHFYSLWGYVLLAKPEETAPAALAGRYAAFMERVIGALDPNLAAAEDAPEEDAVARYALNVRGANTDTTPRRERHDALATALNA
jgi:hypothetical protein